MGQWLDLAHYVCYLTTPFLFEQCGDLTRFYTQKGSSGNSFYTCGLRFFGGLLSTYAWNFASNNSAVCPPESCTSCPCRPTSPQQSIPQQTTWDPRTRGCVWRFPTKPESVNPPRFQVFNLPIFRVGLSGDMELMY